MNQQEATLKAKLLWGALGWAKVLSVEEGVLVYLVGETHFCGEEVYAIKGSGSSFEEAFLKASREGDTYDRS